MSTSSCESVHFSISGEFLTDHYRSLVREGNWRMAFEQLKESFTTAMDLQMVVDILTGKNKLVGENTVDVLEDTLHQDAQWVHDQYFTYFHNVFFFDKQAYKAYACVEFLTYEDMKKARERYETDPFPQERTNEIRALTYARDAFRDRAFYMDDQGWILCEPVTLDYPVWLTKGDIEDASGLSAYQTLRGLLRLNTREEVEYLERRGGLDSQIRMPSSFGSSLADVATERLDRFMDESRKAQKALDELDELRQEIAEKADQNGGWIELQDESKGKTYKLPKLAFQRWCLSNNGAWETIDWKPVSPQGMKMGGDDPFHTDWWLFTGYDLEDVYDEEIMSFFSDQRHRIHKELTGHEFVTLLRGESIIDISKRIARHVDTPDKIFMINRNDLVIIPTASPEFEAVAHKCAELGAVLMTEVGGKLCHLATIGREFGLTLLMLPDARSLLPMGCDLILDLAQGNLAVMDLDAETAMTLKLSGQMYK